MGDWRVLARTHDFVTLSRGDAVLVIETSRIDACDPDLEDAIARLAPHLPFGECMRREAAVERVAITKNQRVIVGRLARGTASVAYMVASCDPLEVDSVVAQHLPETSQFDYLAD
jgi:hypothetical protein